MWSVVRMTPACNWFWLAWGFLPFTGGKWLKNIPTVSFRLFEWTESCNPISRGCRGLSQNSRQGATCPVPTRQLLSRVYNPSLLRCLFVLVPGGCDPRHPAASTVLFIFVSKCNPTSRVMQRSPNSFVTALHRKKGAGFPELPGKKSNQLGKASPALTRGVGQQCLSVLSSRGQHDQKYALL